MTSVDTEDDKIYKRLEKHGISSTCRICLSNTPGLHSVFSTNCWFYNTELIGFNLVQFFKETLNVVFKQDEHYSQKICEGCLSHITAIYIFKKKCDRATLIFDEFIEKNAIKLSKNEEEDQSCVKTPEKVAEIQPLEIEDSENKKSQCNKFKVSLVSAPLDKSESEVNKENGSPIMLPEKDNKNDRSIAKSNSIEDNTKSKDTVKDPEVQSYTCSICNHIASSLEQLAEHEQINDCTIYRCEVCDASFKSKNLCDRHECGHRAVNNILSSFQCRTCTKTFTNERSLRVHSRNHKKVTAYKCSYCDDKFTEEQQLLVHERLHTHKHTYVCEICGIGYPQKSLLNVHARTHVAEKAFTCEECQLVFESIAALTSHMPVHKASGALPADLDNSKSKSSDENPPVDTPINRNLTDVDQQPDHSQILTDEQNVDNVEESDLIEEYNMPDSFGDDLFQDTANQVYKCSVCKTIVSSFEKLTEHRKAHGKKIYQCTVCDVSFRSRSIWVKHRRVHVLVKKILGFFQCCSCTETFQDERSMRVHYRYHKKSKTFDCSFCNRKFTVQRHFENHEKTHTGKRPFVCQICKKGFIQKNNLVIHVRTHTGEKPFKCNECGKGFTSGASLSLHMPVHTGIKDFVCTICGKRMARSGELTIHMRTHTGEKPYSCQTCSKSFIKKSSLQAHLLTHSGEKNYICPICGIRIAHAGKLTVHMRTHTGDKPFACPVCHKCFANQAYLKQHSKIHIAPELTKRKVLESADRKTLKQKDLNKSTDTQSVAAPGLTNYKVALHHSEEEYLKQKDFNPHTDTAETPGSNKFKALVCHCGRTYLTQKDLIKHMDIHTAHLKFKCHHCEFATDDSNVLSKHVKTTHKESASKFNHMKDHEYGQFKKKK